MSEKYSVDDILAELEQRKDSSRNESDEYPKLEKRNRHEIHDIKDIQFEQENYVESINPSEIKRTDSDYLPDINSGSFSLTEELKVIEQRRGIVSQKESVQYNLNTDINKTEKEQSSIGRVDFISNRTERESNFTDNKSKEVKQTASMSVTSILDDERLKSEKTNAKGLIYNNVNAVTQSNKYNNVSQNNQDIQNDIKIQKNEKLQKFQDIQATQVLDENLQGKYKPQFTQFDNHDRSKRNIKPRKGEIVFEKARVLPKPLIENINPENSGNNLDTEIKSKNKEQDLDLIKKRSFSILERDIALEHPNELIDGINPYEIISATSGENMKSTEKPSDEKENSQYDDIRYERDDYMAGDTMGVAGNDLKELASRSAEKAVSASSTAEVGVKRYEPIIENKRKPVPNLATEKAKRSNTALLESLNKAIREKRESDIAANRTLPLNRNNNGTKTNLPANALNINYEKQIILDTAATTSISLNADPVLAEQKIMDLATKRKRKIRDFVLEDIESDENDPTYYDVDVEDYENEDDFDSFDSSGQIWKDLCNLHNSLKLRFIILLVVTCILVFITAMNDFQKNMAFSIVGTDILFLDKRYDPTGFLYLNLILGVIGLASCGTVITGGITRLFKGKGDCDSICAVPAVISLICVVPQLANTDFIQRSIASVFIAAGLSAMLFNTIGKLVMIKRAKRNFRFISGDNAKYYANLVEDSEMSHALTKGMLSNLPVLAAMRKTEFLTDFLKNSYCTDAADMISRLLTPISFGIALVVGFLTYIISSGTETNMYWALTAGCGMLTVLSPFSMMFIVNGPLNRAVKSLEKNDSVVMGYSSAVEFSNTNSVLVDASSLFPAGSVAFRNIKRCQQSSSLNAYAIDEAIITAASLAIKSGSILTSMFYDMIAGKNELLYDVENCIYEVNMGISGWIGNKRIMLGNREQMKHHGISVPDIKKERKYCSENGDVVYLAVGGETVSMFFIEIIPNSEILRSMQELVSNGISIVVRTKDSLVTINKIANVFDVPPEMLRILPFSMHGAFEECTKYTSRGSSAIACNGTFTSFATSIIAAKKIVSDVNISTWVTYIGLFIAVVLGTLFIFFMMPQIFTSTNVIIYNLALFALTAVIQRFKRYG